MNACAAANGTPLEGGKRWSPSPLAFLFSLPRTRRASSGEESLTNQASRLSFTVNRGEQPGVKGQVSSHCPASVEDYRKQDCGLTWIDLGRREHLRDRLGLWELEPFLALESDDITERDCCVRYGALGAVAGANAASNVRKTDPPD